MLNTNGIAIRQRSDVCGSNQSLGSLKMPQGLKFTEKLFIYTAPIYIRSCLMTSRAELLISNDLVINNEVKINWLK